MSIQGQGVYATYTGQPVQLVNQPVETQIRHAIQRMQQNCATLSSAIVSLRETADRLLGGEPQESAKPGPIAVPAGDMGALSEEIESIERMIGTLNYQIKRLAVI